MVEKVEGSYPDYVGDNRSSEMLEDKYGDNYEYFETIPDELVILIFTKLISSSDKAVDTVDGIKLLAQCSMLSKRFNVLVWQLPTLSINCPSIIKLYHFCPKFLKKFKHITSLQVNHRSSQPVTELPFVMWDATYRPHSYCISVVSCNSFTFYQDQQFRQSLMTATADDYAKDAKLFASVYYNYLDLMCLHHMLVSSIKDLEYLQRVVVANLDDGGVLILEADVLVALRNCSPTNLEQVQVRCRSRCYGRYDLNYGVRGDGFVGRNFFFHIIEWREKTTHDQIDKNNVYDDDDGGIPQALAFRGIIGEAHKFFLARLLLPNTDDMNDSDIDGQAIHTLLLKLKSAGNLL